MTTRLFPRIPRVGIATLGPRSATEMECLVVDASATGLQIELPAGRSCRRGSRHILSIEGMNLPVRVAWVDLRPGRCEGDRAGVEIDVSALDRPALRAYSQWVVSGIEPSALIIASNAA